MYTLGHREERIRISLRRGLGRDPKFTYVSQALLRASKWSGSYIGNRKPVELNEC